ERMRWPGGLSMSRKVWVAGARRTCDGTGGEAGEQAAREARQPETVKLAERRPQETTDEPRRQARETRLEMEDWADGILSTLEVNLDKFLAAGKRGRERLHERSQESGVAGVAAGAGGPQRGLPGRRGTGGE